MNFENHKFYNCEITTADNEKFLVDANWLHNEKLDYWKGWNCSAGSNRILVEADFSIYSGECYNDHLGNITTGWELIDGLAICNKDRCSGCTDDLLTTKFK